MVCESVRINSAPEQRRHQQNEAVPVMLRNLPLVSLAWILRFYE